MSDSPSKVRLAIIGAGSRGTGYASFAEAHPDRVAVTAVAEPNPRRREALVERFGIPAENVFTHWEDLAACEDKVADAVVVATQDRQHRAPAIALAQGGYHMLLEKPMAPTEEDCRAIVAAVKEAGILFAVAHVMRYTRYTTALKQLIDSGRIGDVITVQHLEPVGFWHQAHSFVRGNWHSAEQSTFMLMAKSCHDLDWLRYIVGSRFRAVSSFGRLSHFTPGNRPAGAAERCLDCAVEADCAYSASRFYLGHLQKGNTGWPVDVITGDPNPTEESVREALRTGPYGRCVYSGDNDVVDHQVVSMDFENGATASFTMTAFNEAGPRRTGIFGTRGEIRADGVKLEIFDFLTGKTETIDTDAQADVEGVLQGHGGGDYGLMRAFIDAVAAGDGSPILSGPDATLESHLAVFAAESARDSDQVARLIP
ncbi:MAG: Gfo/Idh/MocA family oxidoreductase [Verrucomicrobiae bacterium]|nr:Gfo/Idh/MocA family oxidoreductase [Verrucomicrobiae bacterium]